MTLRLKNADIDLLERVLHYITSSGCPELVEELEDLVLRLRADRVKTRDNNRNRARRNREAGYVWPSTQRPNRSKYFTEEEHDK